ncbi:MAG TPA: ABC transporter permease [Chitinophagaceae bacterium]|nr:ABC transporter permease [Chitinophagaceae bacterium]MCB9054391.1 ABC transporter permease [Chitinophagales bacterium]HPG12553.1 ABC transporter permease [Chitinophagaceae bacterium]HRX94078.1 ABC transporter permease [Chitinophagaceae bacterium]
MNVSDIFSFAFGTIRSNKLRTGLTISIIAFGIMALVGIITAIKAMNQKFTESFSTMGANAFTIRYKERNIHFGGQGDDIKLSKKGKKKEKKSNLGKIITKDEAELFVKRFNFPSTKSISLFGNRNNLVSYQSKKTSPNVMLFGGDENYLQLNGFSIQKGRNFSLQEVKSGSNVCMLGYDVAKRLFGENVERSVNAIVRVNNIPYRVLGVLESRGSSFGFSRDNLIISTYNNVHKNFPSGYSFVIAVMTNDLIKVNQAMGEAEGVFRPIRKLSTTEESNFTLDKSDSIVEKALNSLRFLTISATVIGLITLIGAAIGLMNIMLVSVSERTREVGLVKAIGGKSQMISRQFLLEAIMISVLGALFGIVLGVMLGNLFSIVLNTGFVVPWNWVFYGIFICTLVGLLAGIYPALKAGKLNPIEALRYE